MALTNQQIYWTEGTDANFRVHCCYCYHSSLMTDADSNFLCTCTFLCAGSMKYGLFIECNYYPLLYIFPSQSMSVLYLWLHHLWSGLSCSLGTHTHKWPINANCHELVKRHSIFINLLTYLLPALIHVYIFICYHILSYVIIFTDLSLVFLQK